MPTYKLYPRKTFSRYMSTGTVTDEHGETFACYARPLEIGVMERGGELRVDAARSCPIEYPPEWGPPTGPCSNTGATNPPAAHGVHFDIEAEEFKIL